MKQGELICAIAVNVYAGTKILTSGYQRVLSYLLVKRFGNKTPSEAELLVEKVGAYVEKELSRKGFAKAEFTISPLGELLMSTEDVDANETLTLNEKINAFCHRNPDSAYLFAGVVHTLLYFLGRRIFFSFDEQAETAVDSLQESMAGMAPALAAASLEMLKDPYKNTLEYLRKSKRIKADLTEIEGVASSGNRLRAHPKSL